MAAPRKYSEELRSRAVRLYRESDPKPSFRELAVKLNVHPEALRTWIRQDEADVDTNPDRLVTIPHAELHQLRKENAELKRVNQILKNASVLFAAELSEVC